MASRLSDGINVWNDPWLPGLFPFKPHGPASLDVSQLQVTDLLLPDRSGWNQTLLRAVFSANDITRINSLRSRSESDQDVLMWSFESSGEYSVKSDYHLLQHHESEEVSPLDEKLWTTIWRSPMLKKTKFFI